MRATTAETTWFPSNQYGLDWSIAEIFKSLTNPYHHHGASNRHFWELCELESFRLDSSISSQFLDIRSYADKCISTHCSQNADINCPVGLHFLELNLLVIKTNALLLQETIVVAFRKPEDIIIYQPLISFENSGQGKVTPNTCPSSQSTGHMYLLHRCIVCSCSP
jgi:hypothetical protein